MVLGFCKIVCVFSVIKNFSQCMNMHSIMKTAFDNYNHEISKTYEISEIKKRAPEEHKDSTSLELIDNREKFNETSQKIEHPFVKWVCFKSC